MFFDRYDAGKQLAQKLEQYRGENTVIYALPRGGVLTGLEITKVLAAPLDIVITRKIGHPLNSEYAICAITEGGHRICTELGLCGVDVDWLEAESSAQQREAQRRRLAYKTEYSSILAKGKVAILVDDGIATGLTMKAAIHQIKKQKPKKIIVAVPVAPHDVVLELEQIVDEVIVINDVTKNLGAISEYYTHFPEVFDKEVTLCLQQANKLWLSAQSVS